MSPGIFDPLLGYYHVLYYACKCWTNKISRWDLTRGMCSPRGGYGNAVLDAQECQVPLGINRDIILWICRCGNHLHQIRVRVLLFVPNDVGITA